MEYIPCIGNSSYSFLRILLKLYSCFQDGLKQGYRNFEIQIGPLDVIESDKPK